MKEEEAAAFLSQIVFFTRAGVFFLYIFKMGEREDHRPLYLLRVMGNILFILEISRIYSLISKLKVIKDFLVYNLKVFNIYNKYFCTSLII